MPNLATIPLTILSSLSGLLGSNVIDIDERRHLANVSGYTHYDNKIMTSGREVYPRAVAVSENLPLGSKKRGTRVPGYIPQLDMEVFAEDRFGLEMRAKMKPNETWVDIYKPTESEAWKVGRRNLTYFEGTKKDYQEYRKNLVKSPTNLTKETVKQFISPETWKETLLARLPLSISSKLK